MRGLVAVTVLLAASVPVATVAARTGTLDFSQFFDVRAADLPAKVSDEQKQVIIKKLEQQAKVIASSVARLKNDGRAKRGVSAGKSGLFRGGSAKERKLRAQMEEWDRKMGRRNDKVVEKVAVRTVV